MAKIDDYPHTPQEYVCGNTRCDWTTTNPRATCPWCYGHVVPVRPRDTLKKFRRLTMHQHMLETLANQPAQLALYLKRREETKDKCPECADGRFDTVCGLTTPNLRGLNGWRCDVCGHEKPDLASRHFPARGKGEAE